MSERIEQPAYLHIHAEMLPAVALRIQELAGEGFATGHVVIGHDVQAADDLQPALGNKFAEGPGFFRIAFQKGLEICDLIEREAVVGMLLEQTNRGQDVWQAHLQIFFAGLEDGAFPMRMRDEPEGWFYWRGRSRVRSSGAEMAAA